MAAFAGAWALIGCVEAGKDSTHPPPDDCTDGEIAREEGEVERTEEYCLYEDVCGGGPGITYGECYQQYEPQRHEGCTLVPALYDGARMCACIEAYVLLECQQGVPEVCAEPWWACPADAVR